MAHRHQSNPQGTRSVPVGATGQSLNQQNGRWGRSCKATPKEREAFPWALVSQPNRASNPGSSAGNDSTPSIPPLASITAATWVSAWVSTPPTIIRTIDMVAPFQFVNGQGVAHATVTAEWTQPSCSIQLNPESTARTVRATPHTSCHPAGYADLLTGRSRRKRTVLSCSALRCA